MKYIEPYKNYISKNTLKVTRQKIGIRQMDVANQLGFSITDRISHWEKGKALPSLINLARLCALYRKEPHDLYPELFYKVTEETEQKAENN